MNPIAFARSKRGASYSDPSRLIASKIHTFISFVLYFGVTALGAYNARATPSPGQLIELYCFLILVECAWVRFVYKGMQRQGRSIREFFGARWIEPSEIIADLSYAAATMALIYAMLAGLHALSSSADVANPLLTTLPNGIVARLVWLILSIAAGVCEEIVFRGYLQRQLRALLGHNGLAIAVQASVFGVAHIYEGLGNAVHIVFIGLIFGLLALWRGNLRACILAHAAIDLLAGFGI